MQYENLKCLYSVEHWDNKNWGYPVPTSLHWLFCYWNSLNSRGGTVPGKSTIHTTEATSVHPLGHTAHDQVLFVGWLACQQWSSQLNGKKNILLTEIPNQLCSLIHTAANKIIFTFELNKVAQEKNIHKDSRPFWIYSTHNKAVCNISNERL